ncbi:DUF4097 family beta strand repeat-containing protein [Actinomadura livida]|uniref:DUF4097 domain-containing protein n=2 Tax=Actinomadura livida TaxID=79909 RepID=A0A7W7IKS4_9ACTN|nr:MULTISPECIES: DUF4097 family beta strand repeat-containing protein [Actinomadura]MBB4778916.1 hypothetical protein [Actinomadura catellatispora]
MAAAGVTALSACGMAFASTFEDDAALEGGITAVELDDIGAGRVTLRGGASKATVHREVKYRGDRPEGRTHRIEDGVLKLRGCGSRCSVHYTVDLPAGLPVSGDTSSGSIRLSRVGKVDVSTSSGSIHLDDVSGTVKAKTSNGEIEGRGLKGGETDVETSNGEITLRPAKPQNIRAKTSNGEIKVTVPAASYRVSARTGNGDRKIDVPNAPSARYGLDLTTSNGDITVRPAG